MTGKSKRTPPFKKPIKERFFNSIEKIGDCWIWTGWVAGKPPLPVIKTPEGRLRSARRISLEIAGLEIPVRITTSCGERLCVNPDHIVKGTGRDSKGKKLNEEKVWEILDLLEAGELSQYQIADKVQPPSL